MKTLKWINIGVMTSVAALAVCTSTAQADLIHRYSFTTDTSDSVGSADGTLVGTVGGGPAVSGGQLQLNNPGFSGPSSGQNYLSLSPGILPSSGSATIEEWFTFTGSGFFTEAYAFSDSGHDATPPGSNNGQYLMGVISAPQGGPNTGSAGGSHISQTLAGYAGGETDAYETTPGLGAGGGGYLDDGGTYMMATVINFNDDSLTYYLNGLLQQTITAIPLSSYSFTDCYLGRSAFPGDNSTSGSIDEFRIYNNVQSADSVLADYTAGPNTVIPVPEPTSLTLAAVGALGLLARRRFLKAKATANS